MNWIKLNSLKQLEEITHESQQNPVLIFKHSTTCSISHTALDRLERNYKTEEAGNLKSYFLDLLSHRDVSNAVAQKFGVVHESPQAIIIKKGKAFYSASHFEIDFKGIVKRLSQN